MSISSTSRKAGPYSGNDVATAFAFAFKVFSEADVLVVFTSASNAETVLTLTTDYTVTLNADQDTNPGGSVTLPAALVTGTKLTITSSVADLQPVTLTNNGGFYPRVINDALDRATIQIQQLKEKLGRALVWPISLPGATLPLPEASKFIGWNATADSLANLSGVAVGDAQTVLYTPAGTGAVATDVQSKMREIVSVKDFGAVGDGTTDDTAPVIAAVAAALAAGALLYWPAGTYLTASSIANLHSVRHFGLGGLKRGSDVYYWDVTDRDVVNIVYCSSSGLDANDGISSSQAMSIASVKTYLENIGNRAARGRWRVQFAAGTYTRGLQSTKLPPFARYLELRGTFQSIPSWSATQAVTYGECRLAQSSSMLYRCVAAGTTSGTEPSSRTPTVTDGTVIWSYIAGWLPWVTSQSVTSGDYRKNASKVYVAKSSGTTGATAPTHTTGAASDGTVSWAYVGIELPLPAYEGTTIFDGSLNPMLWATSTAVQIGDVKYYGTHCYRARTAATTGATPPTHTSGSASDGSVTWDYLGERDTNVPIKAIDLNPSPRINILYSKFHNFQNATNDDTAGAMILNGPTEHLMQYTIAGNCNMGAYHHGGCEIYHQNTIYDACDSGIFAIYHVGATIGGPNPAQSTFIKNCTNGVYLSRESVAHVDYCAVDSCRNDGVFGSIMSRFRGVGSHFLRNATAIYLIGSSEWGDTPGTDCAFYLGTTEKNTTKQRLDAYSRFGDGSGYEHQYGGGELRYDSNWTPATSTSSGGDIATVVTVVTMKRLPAEWALDVSKKVRVVVRGTLTGTAGTKNIIVSLGSGTLGGTGSLSAPTTGAFVFEVNAVPTAENTWSSSTKLEYGTTNALANYTGLTAYVVDANGNDYNNSVLVTRNFSAAGDAVTISSVEVFITG